ncbi:MAG TPA: DNA-3-methyladenine glycosylase I [Ignavibacteria bacterium]|nr:DNA-3-methyladenine glycosylase I [Ignavibacteria bacterium]
MKKDKSRCGWCLSTDVYKEYHDKEWGVPVHNDNKLFEFLILEGFQAGLSWLTILNKRENFRKAFNEFNPEKIVRYNEKKIEQLLNNPGIVRNKLKINAAVTNARMFLKTQEDFGSFDKYIWQFTNGKTKHNYFESLKELPARTKESDAMSKDLIKRGFKFVGSTICYAHMQATGMVNDHLVNCYRHKQILISK